MCSPVKARGSSLAREEGSVKNSTTQSKTLEALGLPLLFNCLVSEDFQEITYFWLELSGVVCYTPDGY